MQNQSAPTFFLCMMLGLLGFVAGTAPIYAVTKAEALAARDAAAAVYEKAQQDSSHVFGREIFEEASQYAEEAQKNFMIGNYEAAKENWEQVSALLDASISVGYQRHVEGLEDVIAKARAEENWALLYNATREYRDLNPDVGEELFLEAKDIYISALREGIENARVNEDYKTMQELGKELERVDPEGELFRTTQSLLARVETAKKHYDWKEMYFRSLELRKANPEVGTPYWQEACEEYSDWLVSKCKQKSMDVENAMGVFYDAVKFENLEPEYGKEARSLIVSQLNKMFHSEIKGANDLNRLAVVYGYLEEFEKSEPKVAAALLDDFAEKFVDVTEDECQDAGSIKRWREIHEQVKRYAYSKSNRDGMKLLNETKEKYSSWLQKKAKKAKNEEDWPALKEYALELKTVDSQNAAPYLKKLEELKGTLTLDFRGETKGGKIVYPEFITKVYPANAQMEEAFETCRADFNWAVSCRNYRQANAAVTTFLSYFNGVPVDRKSAQGSMTFELEAGEYTLFCLTAHGVGNDTQFLCWVKHVAIWGNDVSITLENDSNTLDTFYNQ